jgi:hypothetical protein
MASRKDSWEVVPLFALLVTPPRLKFDFPLQIRYNNELQAKK